MAIFVTGASGFVGGAVARHFAATQGVFGMARSPGAAAKVAATGASPVTTDLSGVCSEHLRGCEAVIHAAAKVEAWGSRRDFWDVNVVGTEKLLAAAREAGVRRFVYISTEVVLFRGQHLRQVTEDYPYPTRSPYLYGLTKAEAERRVMAANSPDQNFTTIVVRPKMIWGPGDTTILPTTAEMVRSGRFMWLDGGEAKTSTTYIDNLVHGIRLALERGTGGAVYFINDGEVHSLRDFLTRLLATEGLVPPGKSIPGWIGRALASALATLWRLLPFRGEPPLTPYVAGALSRDCTLSIDKARRELGYEPLISVSRGLEILNAQNQA